MDRSWRASPSKSLHIPSTAGLVEGLANSPYKGTQTNKAKHLHSLSQYSVCENWSMMILKGFNVLKMLQLKPISRLDLSYEAVVGAR